MPVCRLSELGALTRLCLHRPVANRQLWVAVVISAEPRPSQKTSAWQTCFQAHIPSICPGGSPCDPLTGRGLMRNGVLCQFQL